MVRRLSLLISALALGIAVLLGALSSRPSVSPDAARALASATTHFDSLVRVARGSRPSGARGDQLAISFGYLERLRLGLGSPFRLVDEVLGDPRLGAAARTRVAWAVLGRLRRGESYIIDPSTLDGFGPWGVEGHGATGAAHLAFIDHAIRSASDPRAGELSIRLAYKLASAQGAIAPAAAGVAVQVAALTRDRALAELDLRDVLADANALRSDVLDLVRTRRSARVFRVEQPTLAPLSRALQVEAMDAVPSLLAALDTLDRATERETLPRGANESVLNPWFAARLGALGAAQPPVAQVGVTLSTRLNSDLRATNGETLAASYAATVARGDSAHRDNTLAVLASAVALRSLAQSPPWFPGDGGPDAGDLNAEFGLANVSFGRGVPVAWRPYYMRELQSGLRDLQRVLPGFSSAGLRVRFGAEVLPDSALAMHEPRTRTLQLSVSASAGTLAHELSHDLDWQAARRLFADGTGYSTDRAMQERRGSLAASVEGLVPQRPYRSSAHATATAVAGRSRPAELFARGADWFVTSALAQQGRMNGFLSVAQDGLLNGYAAGVPAAQGLAGTSSLLSAIAEMTYVPDSIRKGFEAQWSDPRLVDPALLVQRVLDTPIRLRRTWPAPAGAADILAASRAELCVADGSAETRARQRLLMLAIDARASRLAAWRSRFQATPTPIATGVAERVANARARWRDAARSALVASLTTDLADQGLVPLVPAIFAPGAATCAAMSE